MSRLEPFQGWRLTVFRGVIFAIFFVFIIRLYQFQIIDTNLYEIAADDNRLSELPLAAPRGTIEDRFERLLAVNVPAFNVTIIPAALPSSEEDTLNIYNRLSALTGVPPTRAIAEQSGQRVRSIEEFVIEGLGIRPYNPVIIAQDVGQEVALQILEERSNLPGVDVQAASVREYPTGELTSHLIGYMGPIGPDEQLELIELGYNPAFDRIGYAGLEQSLESVLSGQRGREVREVDVAGLTLRRVERTEPTAGFSLRLTIDSGLQRAAQAAVTNRIAILNAAEEQIVTERGAVIAMNPNTGEVLAMVSYPSYDNARFARNIDVEYYLQVADDPLRPLVNQATQSLYPPGSVFKLITSIGVLGEDIINPSTFLTDPGDLLLPNRYAPNDRDRDQRFVCWLRTGHGNVDLLGGIANSCNVYFYQIGGGNPEISPAALSDGGLGITNLFRYSTMFGLGSPLNIETPFFTRGRFPDPDWKRRLIGQNWATGDTYNAAVGQGYVTTTPLHMATAVSAIVNGGTLIQPTLIREVLDADGNVVRPFSPRVLRTTNLDLVGENDIITLLPLEDMIMKGSNSLVCSCEPDSEFYNPLRCNPVEYRAQVDVNPDPLIDTLRDYRVSVPEGYAFDDALCTPVRFEPDYRPAFTNNPDIELVQAGMRQAVTVGTAAGANLSYVEVFGKTGTAEYCDDIARPLGLCEPGNWPSHAWFTGAAPYENPEIVIIGFVYNGDEGLRVALPMVMETMEAYFCLKNEREVQGILADEQSACLTGT
jgi:penicillin-binding protein 2